MSTNASQSSLSSRINWIDAAKGFGLLLVVYGHFMSCPTDSLIFKIIYSFHMPMFFMLSGYLIKPVRQSLAQYIGRKAKTLLLPAAVSILVMLPLFFIKMKIDNIQMSLPDILATIFFYNGKIAFNIPVWFLITMFEISLFAGVVRLASMPLALRLMFSALCFAFGYFIYTYSVFIPFGLDKAVCALGFYSFGSAAAVLQKRMKPFVLKIVVLLSVCGFILLTVFYTVSHPNLSLYDMTLGNYWCFLLLGLTGSISLFGLSYAFSSARIIREWGQNTVFVVATHILPYAVITLIAQKLGIFDTAFYSLGSFGVSIILLFVYMPICRWVNKNIAFMNGRAKSASSNVTA